MSRIPEQTAPDPKAILADWFTAKAAYVKAQARERLLREQVVKLFFPAPKEGTNAYDLKQLVQGEQSVDGWEGYVLKMTHGFDRKIDKGAFEALRKMKLSNEGAQQVLEHYGFNPQDITALLALDADKLVLDVLNISVDRVVRMTPELAVKEWRTLTAEQHKVFDSILEVKPSSPQVTIEPTAGKKKELEAAEAPKRPEQPPLEIPVFVGGSKPPF